MTVVKPGDKVARVRAQMLHILYEIGREEHQFRLRFNGQYLRDAFYLEDYNLESNSVVHMVPLSDKKDDVGLVKMSFVVRKPVFGVSDQVRHKPGCTATEDG